METLVEPTTGLSPTPTCKNISNAQTLVITIDDSQPDKSYSVDCCHPGTATSANDVDPLRVPASEKCIQFVLRPNNWKFAGFLSPQDPKHVEFEVDTIDTKGEYTTGGNTEAGLSRMLVRDRHGSKTTYRYELLFYKANKPWDLYNFDPQIKNT